VLEALAGRGIARAELTLHVGEGTFSPIKEADPALHRMHREWYELSEPTARRILEARAAGRPVIAVGTTTVRALESWAAAGCPAGLSGWSELFIRPPFAFRAVDGLITNFHLPRSTLLLLVSAFHGRERLLAAYGEAIEQRYRFYSFGDCMAILPAV
jgi:S-adenosylmethionine:tRNA ribosyltransferase-isomerase